MSEIETVTESNSLNLTAKSGLHFTLHSKKIRELCDCVIFDKIALK